MERNDTILQELKEVSPVMASIGNRVPYAVPHGYFEGLAVQVMLRIAMAEKNVTDPGLNISKENIYQVPGNYFENLAGNILNRIKLNEASNAKEELELLSPALSRIEKKMPFTTPDGYFNELSDNVVVGMQAIEFVNEELENLSPLMASLKKKNVYDVPQGYFENTPAEILHKAMHQPAKVVSISFRKRVIRYAAAAMFTGAMAVGGYFYFTSGNKAVDAQAPNIAKVSDQELESFVNNNTITLADISPTPATEISEDDTKDLFADVSDEELQQYLEQHGGTPNSIPN